MFERIKNLAQSVNDRFSSFGQRIKAKAISVNERFQGRIVDLKKSVSEIIKNAPANAEAALKWVGRQAVDLSKSAGQVGYNIVSQTGKGVSETVGDTFKSSFFTGPVILGGIGLAGFTAYKLL